MLTILQILVNSVIGHALTVNSPQPAALSAGHFSQAQFLIGVHLLVLPQPTVQTGRTMTIPQTNANPATLFVLHVMEELLPTVLPVMQLVRTQLCISTTQRMSVYWIVLYRIQIMIRHIHVMFRTSLG